MKRPSFALLLIAQTVLLVLVAWAAVYFARDEFLLATAPSDATPDAAPLADGDDGVPTVHLSAAAQRNVGIDVAPLQPTVLAGSTEVPVSVLDVQPLAELRGRLLSARQEMVAAQTTAAASTAERRRVQALFDDEQSASRRALEAANAQAAADAARARGASAAWAAVRDGARATWGAQLAGWLAAEPTAGTGRIVDTPLARVLAGRDVLLRATVRDDAAVQAAAPLQLQLPGSAAPVTATALGAASPADALGSGRTLLYRAALPSPGLLAPGMRLSARLASAAAGEPGALVPASAIVWHAGQPWVYVRESDAPVAAAAKPGDGAAASGAAGAAARSPAARAHAGAEDDDDDDAPARPASAPGASAMSPMPANSGNFQRRAVPQARRVGDQWFLPGFTEDDPVVVRGTQVLLSEEFRFQIRNENDD